MTNKDSDIIRIKRYVLSGTALNNAAIKSAITSVNARGQGVIDFKAMSMRNGNTKRISENRRANSLNFKASGGLGRVAHTIGSLAIPGDTDPIRSPVRSAIYRTLTPGFGGSTQIRGPKDRGYRCPEGYQYGGRFTDSRLSTCGAKLFDIPSPLGLALAAIRRAARSRKPDEVTGKPIVGAPPGDSLIQSRRPQIPKVTGQNLRELEARKNELIRDMARHNEKVSRMVRRDGFVLEPVVSPSVLRAIPDNRDMEGATYLMSAFGPPDIGNDELGMLSNTGIQRLIYVAPSGATITIEKKRPLTVGERRKLGKVVNVASELPNNDDPGARLKKIAQEIGDGIGYEENLAGAKDINGIFKRAKGSMNIEAPSKDAPEETAAAGKVSSIDAAIKNLQDGGSIADIDPSIIPDVMQKMQNIKRTKLDNNQEVVQIGNKQYLEYTKPEKFQHLAEFYAMEIQRALGLEAPQIFFTSKDEESRRYMRQNINDVIPDSKLNQNAGIASIQSEDMAKIMIADYLSDQRKRPESSINIVSVNNSNKPILSSNTSSGLVALDKISISKRSKMTIDEFYGSEKDGKIDFEKLIQQLSVEQKIAYQKFLDSLIRKAQAVKLIDIKKRLRKMGLSEAEQAHINIIEKIFEIRLGILNSQRKEILDRLVKVRG